MQLNVMRYRRKWHVCRQLNNTWIPTKRRFDHIDNISRYAKSKGYDWVIVRQNTGKKDSSSEVGDGEGTQERSPNGDAGGSV